MADSPSSASAGDDEEHEVLEQGGGLLAELRSIRRLILLPFVIGAVFSVIAGVIALIGIIFSSLAS